MYQELTISFNLPFGLFQTCSCRLCRFFYRFLTKSSFLESLLKEKDASLAVLLAFGSDGLRLFLLSRFYENHPGSRARASNLYLRIRVENSSNEKMLQKVLTFWQSSIFSTLYKYFNSLIKNYFQIRI